MTPSAQETITSYVTDMLALEEHMQTAFAGQVAELKGGRFASVIGELESISSEHLIVLRALAERRERGGQGIAGAVKKAAASVLGLGAAAIDMVRTERLPKNLRDDYTSVSLATIGYLMLHTTAETLDDAEVAELALAHLRDYSKATMTLFDVVPDAVVAFLAEEGFPTNAAASSRINEALEEIWDADA